MSSRAKRGICFFLFSIFHLFLLRSGVALAQDKPTSLSDARSAIEANLRTTEGKHYDEQLGTEFMRDQTATFRRCRQSSGDTTSFWILMKLNKDGTVREVLLAPETKLGSCARQTLLKSKFSPPPRADYWVGIYMQLHK